jgi:hypothetical protein
MPTSITQKTNLINYIHSIKLVALLLLSIFLSISCTEEEDKKDPDIYVAGTETSTTVQQEAQATIWKNGVPVRLTNGTRQAVAYSVFVAGTDVYAAGFENNQFNRAAAKYWKNGVAVNLSNNGFDTFATHIAVSGNDVYVTGYGTGFSYDKALLWKNGVLTELTNGTYEARAEEVYVSGNDVYVAGWEYNENFVRIAKYWKNGNEVVLTNGTADASALSIVVSGEDVYVCGMENRIATVWKNGIAQKLGSNSKVTIAHSITLQGSDVFVAGADDTNAAIPFYWKNGKSIALEVNESIMPRSIFVLNNSIYIAGGGFAGNGRSFAQYWENGKPIRLTTNNQNAYAYSIYVNQ